jgi:hypothetical protein
MGFISMERMIGKVALLFVLILVLYDAFGQDRKGNSPQQLLQSQELQKRKSSRQNEVSEIQQASQSAIALAKAALEAHGGDKFKNIKSLVIKGTAEVSGSPTATFPASFYIVFAGDKYVLEINNPIQPFKQAYDGKQVSSSFPNFSLPPINRLGLPLLQRLNEEGFVVSELPSSGKNKKKLGFRITSPEGYYTDFFLDEKTKRVKSYEASYFVANRAVTTSVEIEKWREVEGIVWAERYFQRFDLGNLAVYVDFRAKEILVNQQIDDEVFSMR